MLWRTIRKDIMNPISRGSTAAQKPELAFDVLFFFYNKIKKNRKKMM